MQNDAAYRTGGCSALVEGDMRSGGCPFAYPANGKGQLVH